MSSLGDKIKSVFGGGDHSTSTEAGRGEVDRHTPGAFPSEESSVRPGADQSHIGSTPVPSSGRTDLGGTSQDPGFITGPSEHNKEPSKLHKKDDPRGNTGFPSHDNSSTAGHGHVHTGAGLGSSSTQRDGSSAVPGTGVSTGAGTVGGIHASELGSDRSGTKADDGFTSGLEGTRAAGHTGQHGTSGLTGSQHGTSGLTGSQHGTSGLTGSQHGTSGLTDTQRSSTGPSTGTGLAAGAATAAGAGALAGREHNSHNTVNNGREKSTVQSGSHEEPYWGDLPQGEGVYNSVTGHGSGENTTSQHRSLPHRTGDLDETARTGTSGNSGLAPGAGVYNTVTGHGSNEEHDPSHRSPHDRAFPLGTGARDNTSSAGTRGTSSNPLSPGTSSSLSAGDNSQRERYPGATGTSSNLGERDNSHKDRHVGESALGAGAAGAAAGYGASKLGHHDSNNPQHIGEHDSDRSSANPLSSKGNSGASYLPNTSGTSAGTPQQQTTAGNKDPSAVASSQPTTHKTGSMLDIGDDGTGPARNTAGPHKSDALNKVDPRVDSDRDGSKTYGGDKTSSHTGRDTAGVAGAGAAAGAAYGAHEHSRHKDHSEPTTSSHTHQSKEKHHEPKEHHESKLLGFLHHNKDDKLVGQDAQGSSLPAATQHSAHDDHTARNAGLAGAGAAGAGYGASRLGQHHNEPSIGQRDSGLSGSRDTSGLGSTTGTHGTSEGTHGPHSSRVANAADPRVDSDRDGSGGIGSTHDRSSHGLTGSLHGNDDSHTGRNLAGAGAAAGAGYGASRLGHHDNDPTSRTGTSTSGLGSGNTSGQYNTLSGGTPSGISTGTNHGTSTGINDTRGAPTSLGASGGTHSHGGAGQYNTLSSGTPSGVHLDDTPTSGSHSSPLGGASSIGKSDPSQSSSHGFGSHAGTGALGGGAAAAAAAKLKSGGRVTHNCNKCGEENDISKYFGH